MTLDLVTRNLLELSELFLTSKSDSLILEQLEDELRYRRDPLALRLLIEVRNALRRQDGPPAAPPANPAGS